MSVVEEKTTQTVPPRRRQRPYLNWLERSRDRWKSHAVEARAEALSLRRQVRRLSNSRNRWRQQALDSRQQLRQEQEKNLPGS